MRNDIKTFKNIISGRQGWAYICNSLQFTVIKADMNKPQEYEDYKVFSKVRIATPFKGRDLLSTGTLELEGDNWSIGGYGCCIKAGFDFNDMMESIEEAGLPVVREHDIVAVAQYTKEFEIAALKLFRVGRVDIHCTTMAQLIPLTDEEMEGIAKDANDWCNR
jgi:hypothetical protein